jgi:hypothetical protein
MRTGPPALAVGCVTAILLGALAARVHPGLVLAAACWLAACAVPLAFTDAAVRRLPDPLTGAAYGAPPRSCCWPPPPAGQGPPLAR